MSRQLDRQECSRRGEGKRGTAVFTLSNRAARLTINSCATGVARVHRSSGDGQIQRGDPAGRRVCRAIRACRCDPAAAAGCQAKLGPLPHALLLHRAGQACSIARSIAVPSPFHRRSVAVPLPLRCRCAEILSSDLPGGPRAPAAQGIDRQPLPTLLRPEPGLRYFYRSASSLSETALTVTPVTPVTARSLSETALTVAPVTPVTARSRSETSWMTAG